MADTRSYPGTVSPSIRDRRGLRVTLLSLAAAILLAGAVTAGLYGYIAISHNSAVGSDVGAPTPAMHGLTP